MSEKFPVLVAPLSMECFKRVLFQPGKLKRTVSFVRQKRVTKSKSTRPKQTGPSGESNAPKPFKEPSLADSKEAQRQLQAGSHLMDGAPAVPVPILEQFFDDADLYTRPNDTLKTPTPYVTPSSPFAQSPRDLKGVQSDVLGKVFSAHMLRNGPLFMAKSTHAIYYFPPWHPVALARRSRPGIVLCFSEGHEHNGAELPKYPLSQTLKSGRSRNPFTYAFWRGKTKRLFKRLFWNAWASASNPRDGLYLLIIDRIPNNPKQTEEALDVFMKKVTALKDFNWVGNHVKQFQVGRLNRTLLSKHYAPVKVWPEIAWKEPKEGRS